MSFGLNSFKLCSLLLLSTILAYFSLTDSYLQKKQRISKTDLFSQSAHLCKDKVESLLFDRPVAKNVQLLCKLSLSPFCKRFSPVEEQQYFYVVCPVYSTNQHTNTLFYQLHTNFKHYCETLGVKFVQVEYAFTSYQDFILTKPDNEPYDIQIPGRNIFYLRENLVNVAEKKLPEDYEYISWIDAHTIFENPYIFQEMIVELGKSNIVAPHSSVYFKDQKNQTSYIKQYPYVYQVYYVEKNPQFNIRYNPKFDYFPFYGLAFATKKSVFRDMNGLPDLCIAGSCDIYMSLALINGSIQNSHKTAYKNVILNWIQIAAGIIDGKFAYVKSRITHLDHSFLLRRQSDWETANKFLLNRHFNPIKDLKRDENGTLYFVDNFELAYDFWKLHSSI